ncbi:hypothetical protein HY450_00530 [Candidatus Pacearchaeota archaeon]|nr:hypothetical protein [Candidatus Pacearchaeota archaeon]
MRNYKRKMRSLLDVSGMARDFQNGFENLFFLLNFDNGEGSSGEKMRSAIMPRSSGPMGHSFFYIAGMAAEVAAEVVVPIYISRKYDVPWYSVLLADAGIKTIPRGIDYLVRKGRDIYNNDKPAVKASTEFGRRIGVD